MEKQLDVDENPYWSPSRIKVMERCKKEYWFTYVRHLDCKVSSDAAIGIHNHRIAERTWLEENGKLVPGFKSYESCIGTSVGNWKFLYALPGVVDGREINWRECDGKGFAKWLIGRIAETAGIIYTRFLSEKPRLRAEVKMQTEFEGFRIMAIADELREGLVIRDHKSGSSKIEEYFLKDSLQMTICSMCLYQCLQKPYTNVSSIYPQFVGIPLDEFLDALKVEINDIFPKIDYKSGFHRANSILSTAKITRKDFEDAIKIINAGRNSLKDRDFHPSKNNCGFCGYKAICNDYNPEMYHMNEQEKLFPLFFNAGIVLDSCHPKKRTKIQQRIIRFKSPIKHQVF